MMCLFTLEIVNHQSVLIATTPCTFPSYNRPCTVKTITKISSVEIKVCTIYRCFHKRAPCYCERKSSRILVLLYTKNIPKLLKLCSAVCFINVKCFSQNKNINYCVRGGHKPARWPVRTDTHTPMTTRPCGLRRAGNDFCPQKSRCKGMENFEEV